MVCWVCLGERTFVADFTLTRGLEIYVGIDPGTGGVLNHPAGIVVVGIDIDRNLITVLSCWRGDGVETTSNDIVKQYTKMTTGLSVRGVIYDHAAKDFYLTFTRECQHTAILGAKKERVAGIERVNSYLHAGAIQIPQTHPFGLIWWDKEEVKKLEDEFRTVVVVEGNKKSGSLDDLTDALRYLCMHLDIDLELVKSTPEAAKGDKLLKHGRHEFYESELRPKTHPEQEYWERQYN